MAELTISSEEIRGALERYVSSYSPDVSREEVGTVADAGDGIAHVEGLPSTMTNELLEFEDGTPAAIEQAASPSPAPVARSEEKARLRGMERSQVGGYRQPDLLAKDA